MLGPRPAGVDAPGARPAYSRDMRPGPSSHRPTSPRPAEGSFAPDRGEAVRLPASDDGAGVLIFANPSSGAEVIRTDPRAVIDRELPAAIVHDLAGGEDPADVVAHALDSDDPPRVLGVCGGDGSVSALAHVARQAGLPLLVLPAGTFNHFARAVGADTPDAGIRALREGRGVQVAVIELSAGGPALTVLNTGSVGVYPQFVAAREGYRGRLGKWLGGVVAAWRVLREAEALDVALDGERMRVWSVFISVGRNDPRRVATMQRQRIDDDVLDVRVLHARGPRRHAVAALAFGRRTAALARALRLMPRDSDIERRLAPDAELTVFGSSDDAPVFVYDGELETRAATGAGDGFTLRCRMLPSALRVYA